VLIVLSLLLLPLLLVVVSNAATAITAATCKAVHTHAGVDTATADTCASDSTLNNALQ
jgi:hypothetical protein